MPSEAYAQLPVPRLVVLAMTRLALAALAALLVAVPASAHASPNQLSIMMDDDRLLYRGDHVRDQTMKRMKELGVDVVRVTVLWSVVAEKARSTPQRRKRFDGRNPRTYPTLNWDRYDRLVRAARTLGLQVYFNVTPPGPEWAREPAPRGLRTVVKRAWKPKSGEFAKFVEAVGRRYSGRYRDENDGRQPLPKVSMWSLLNEPNQAGWLSPQWERGRMTSAAMARELYLRGRAALDRTGHGRDIIMVGETAPLGSSNRLTTSPVRPKQWIRAFLCSNRRGYKCNLFDKYGPIRATHFAHHPYTKNRSPLRRDSHRDSITMANLGELGSLLDTLGRRTKNIRRGLPIFLTEFGFETNPPDPFSGISLERQAEWNQLGDLLAYRNPRVHGQTQFLLRDVAPVRSARPGTKAYWFTYQSGLEFADGRPKPSLQAYYFPFLVSRSGGQIDVWGQLRFRPNHLPPGARDSIQLQYSPDGGQTWADHGTPFEVTNGMGFFQTRVAAPGRGHLRAVWHGTFVTSRPAGVP
jgi:hypothetical protein